VLLERAQRQLWERQNNVVATEIETVLDVTVRSLLLYAEHDLSRSFRWFHLYDFGSHMDRQPSTRRERAEFVFEQFDERR
jgi:Rps23 Pro-64 3,4-dihydroxylase Tpa1-like proline 4-hydroxylase